MSEDSATIGSAMSASAIVNNNLEEDAVKLQEPLRKKSELDRAVDATSKAVEETKQQPDDAIADYNAKLKMLEECEATLQAALEEEEAAKKDRERLREACKKEE